MRVVAALTLLSGATGLVAPRPRVTMSTILHSSRDGSQPIGTKRQLIRAKSQEIGKTLLQKAKERRPSLVRGVRRAVSDFRDVVTEVTDYTIASAQLSRQNLLAWAQAFGALGDTAPDLDQPKQLRQFFTVIQRLAGENRIKAYHDRSDGGLLACVAEMVFAGRVGAQIALDDLGDDALAALFNEELGAVLQVGRDDASVVVGELRAAGLTAHTIGDVVADQRLTISQAGKTLFDAPRAELQRAAGAGVV